MPVAPLLPPAPGSVPGSVTLPGGPTPPDPAATPAPTKAQRTRAFLAAVVGVTIWSASFLASKVALRELSTPEVVAWRFALALPFLLMVARRARPARTDWGRIALVGVIGVPALFLLQVAGVERTTATRAALLIGLIPILSALGGVWLLGERGGRRLSAAVALSTLGVALVVGWPQGGGSLAGDLLVVASTVASVAYVLLSMPLVRRYDAAGMAGWMQAAGTVALLGGVVLWQGVPAVPVTATTWAALAWLSLGCTAIANVLWNVGLRTLGAARAGVVVNLEPLLGAALGVALLGDPLGAGALVGGACILAATVLVQRG